MDPYTLLTLALGAMGVGAFASQHRIRAHIERRRVGSWQRVAAELELDWHGDCLSGWCKGFYLSAFSDLGQTRVAVTLWPPLDLGISVGNRPTQDEQQPVSAGLWLAADDGPRALRLLALPVRRALRSAPRIAQVLTDEHVLATLSSVAGASALREMILKSLSLARAVEAARAGVPPPDAVASSASSWRELAQRRGFSPTSLPFGFVGSDRGLSVMAFTRRRASPNLAACSFAAFRTPLQIGFRAACRAAQSEAPWGTEQLSLDDPEFDAAFEVSAAESQYVRQALSAPARGRLVELARTGRKVWVDDYGVLLEADRLVQADELERMLDAALSVAELVDFIHPHKRRAYR